jgi:L-2,4-diaminobutyrate decarboxylase
MSGSDPFDPEVFRALGHQCIDLLADHLAATNDRSTPVLRWQEPADKLQSLPPLDGSADAEGPLPLLRRLLRESNRLHHPHFVGHQVNPPLPLAALLELTSALLNNGMAVYEMGPLQTAMEQRAVEWMCARLGFAAGADGVLTSGGSIGNLTALLAARQQLPGDAWKHGLQRGCVLVSEQAHYCIDRAVRILGCGEDGVVRVPVDAQFRLRADALPAALQTAQQRGRAVIAVVASACSTATGAFDPLPQIADFCRQHHLWLHVDGAHGASYCLSPANRHLVAGIEAADSVVWDAHKLLQMPPTCSSRRRGPTTAACARSSAPSAASAPCSTPASPRSAKRR